MEKERLLRLAQELLSKVDVEEISDVEVSVETWPPQGEKRIVIEISYPERLQAER